MPRRYYSSVAVETTLSSEILSSATSVTVAATTGYPTSYPFTIVIDENVAGKEELCEVTGAGTSGATWTVTRGVDGTTAIGHSLGATVRLAVSGRDFDEANAHVNTGTNVHNVGAGADVVGTTTSQTLTNKTITGGTVNATTLQRGGTNVIVEGDARLTNSRTPTAHAASHASGGSDALTLAVSQLTAAWQTYNPTFGGNITPGNGTAVGRYIQIGKIVFFAATFTAGSTSSAGTAVGHSVTLPAVNADTTLGINSTQVSFYDDSGLAYHLGSGGIASATTYNFWGLGTNNVWRTIPFTLAANDVIRVAGWYVAA